MLSDRTLGFLEGLAEASNAVYQEGGLLFTFKFAYQQAHVHLNSSSGTTSFISSASNFGLTNRDIENLGRFFQGSLGDYTKEEPSRDALAIAHSLVERLHHDLKFESAALQVHEEGYGMNAQLELFHNANNNFYLLELWWSVD
jgi:hypothetical protein